MLYSFLGLFGIYFALNYLSLSDTTVLTYIVPLGTGFVASRFLGETFTKMEVFASGKCHFSSIIDVVVLTMLVFTFDLVLSLMGVVLIARPPFLFGNSGNGLGEDLMGGRFALIDKKEVVTPAKRMLAVW
jgi:hypothetical protein